MTKKVKVIIILQSIAIVLLVLMLMYVFGWRMFGYTFCTNPNEIEHVKVEETEYNYIIRGSVGPYHVGYYNGYIGEIIEGTFYIGIKNSVFLETTDHSRFTISCPNDVDRIVLKNGKHERVIYEKVDELEE